MRPKIGWIDKATDDSGQGCTVYAMAFKPDGSELIVAADNKILIYDPVDGQLMQTLKAGHKEYIYALDWSHDGELFASGGIDKNVVLWNASQHEGLLKYSHSESVQCIAFSPVAQVLLSCGINDFALWTSAEKNVQKQRVSGRCTSCAWSTDGSQFAVGTMDGCVYLRKTSNFSDDPSAKIERPSGQPVWALCFNCPRLFEDGGRREESDEMLIVTDWGRTLSFYNLNGQIIPNMEKQLNYDPNCIRSLNNDKFIIIGGTNKEVTLYTRNGLLLGKIAQMDTWIWALAIKPNSHLIFFGCVDGTICHYQMSFSTVHGLHLNKYAFRDHMTEIVVQHLSNNTQTRIRCHDCVKKVAIYKDKLAAQLSNELVIYKQIAGDKESDRLEYRVQDKIRKEFECSLLVVTALNVIFCNDNKLECYNQKGQPEREWRLTSNIRYIKTIGGPPGRETILVGLAEGIVVKLFVDNPFPIVLLRTPNQVRCVDITTDRKRLAVNEDSGICTVYDAHSLESLFQEGSCTSVCFNAENDDVICFSSSLTVTIRAGTHPGFHQHLNGFVVGFAGNKVYSLHLYTMVAQEVPFSNQMYQHIEAKQHDGAYRLAAMGVTEEDWRILAEDALLNNNIVIAQKAFSRIKDHKMLQLIEEIKEMQEHNEPEVLMKALILCYQGKYREAAAHYRQSGYENKAVELFSDLKMFDDVQDVMSQASGETQKMLLRKRADWAKDMNQPKVAAEMLISSGDLDKATQLIIDNDWLDLAINVMRKLDRGDIETLRKLAKYFEDKGEYSLAQKIYSSLGDTRAVLQMHVNAGLWTDAFAIAERYPKYVEDVYLPYARFLAEQDRFEEAQKAFHKAGRDKEALQVLEQLTQNAVNENRFIDASYYHWLLSMQYLDRSIDHSELLPKYEEAAKQAEHYYAYDAVFMFCHMPFTSQPLETLLNMARFVASEPNTPNIQMVLVYYTIAKIGRELGAFKFSREALDKLSLLRVPSHLQRQVDIMTLTIRAKPFSDADHLLPVCYRCGLNNSLSTSSACAHCKSPFVYSMATFENLPLLEFFVDESLSSEEAKLLIEAEPPLDDQEYNPFRNADKKKRWVPLILGKDELSRLEKGQVLILPSQPPLKTKYYFNAMPTIALSCCSSCSKVFQQDDYEMAVLQKGACPFCRTPQTRADPSIFLTDE